MYGVRHTVHMANEAPPLSSLQTGQLDWVNKSCCKHLDYKLQLVEYLELAVRAVCACVSCFACEQCSISGILLYSCGSSVRDRQRAKPHAVVAVRTHSDPDEADRDGEVGGGARTHARNVENVSIFKI